MAKRKGRHPYRGLNAIVVKATHRPGRYCDGDGLYLHVDPSGAKRWVLRVVVQGRRRDFGLGGTHAIPLQDARERAQELRRKARLGLDLREDRRLRPAAAPTFAEAARTVFELNKPSWKNRKHVYQWLRSLEQFAFPVIGKKALDQIGPADVLEVLTPIWLTKSETALRVRQRIKVVLEWARTAGFRSGDNPAVAVGAGLPRQSRQVRHQRALPFNEVPAFISKVRCLPNSDLVKLALEFLVLTATRTNEVLQLRWTEVELDLWTLPAERTKSKREFRVPVGARAQEILSAARQLGGGSDFVFPGQKLTSGLSNMTLLMAIRRMGLDVTGHGFRSSFSDWAHETTNFENIVVEMALNHAIKNKAERAYRRGDLFEKRRQLMTAWEAFVTSPAEPCHVGQKAEGRAPP